MKPRRRYLIAMLVLPVATYTIWFLVPLLVTARMSLNDFSRTQGVIEQVGFQQYTTILSGGYLSVWFTTFRVAAETAILTTLVGGALAYFLWRAGGRFRAYLTLIVIAPLLISGIVRVFGWIVTTGPAGILPSITQALGLGEVTIMFNEPAALIGFIHVLMAYAVILILASLDNIDPKVMRAASNLGATRLQVIRRIVMPLTYQGWLASLLWVFAAAATSYAIPVILGGGRVRTLAIELVAQQKNAHNWPRAAAIALVIMVVASLILMLVQRLGRKRGARRVRT